MFNERNKICPKCKKLFTCRQHDIANCDCQIVLVLKAQQVAINAAYDDCLCMVCLQSSLPDLQQRGPIVEHENK